MRLLIIYFGKWALVLAAIIEAPLITILAYQLAKQGLKILALCILTVPVIIHVLAGLTWLPWTGLGMNMIIQLQLLGMIIMVIGLITDLIVTKRRK